jgi:hypothetical protein
MNLFDALWPLLEALPSGFYDGLALERYLRNALLKLGCANEFDQLERDLFIIAADVDSGQRVVFGKDERNNTTICTSRRASPSPGMALNRCSRARRDAPTCRLTRTLAQVEFTLDKMRTEAK